MSSSGFKHPLLRDLIGFMGYPYCDEDILDPREAFECGLAAVQDLPACLEQWHEVKRNAQSEEEHAAFCLRLGLQWVESPEGLSHRRWVEWAESRLEEAISNPRTMLPRNSQTFYPHLKRSGEFHDETAEKLLIQELMERHEEKVARWLERPDSGLRLHLTGDVGWRIGDALEHDARGEEVIRRIPTSRGVVVLKRTDAWGNPDLHALAAYPVAPEEPEGAETHRTRWPQLEQVFGGYFGRDGARWQYPWGVQRALLMDESQAFLSLVRAQLDELLQLPDGSFQTALISLGCYVEPPHVRQWVERIRWRMDTFDWQ
ncbi:hypothetical protein CLV92_1091 [Kineococcus xinjiangensis]|uniref:Uncharacterized protein n=1 Tax=Kineococcus xinjiangensis TaxID=512762 RepID=A0A2S6IHR0_9ACTN|nr:hypothetical protein [Kineococcus xinjiangensis]PPK93725.1 hypothetical protein CLV92_1091 [Kineococcus xinjiangensis]